MHSPVSQHLIKYGSSCEETEEGILSMDMVGLHWPKRPGYFGNWLQVLKRRAINFGGNEYVALSSQQRSKLPETSQWGRLILLFSEAKMLAY